MRTRSRCLMWVRPSFRTYSYNMSVGEHYYTPIRDYVSTPLGSRGTYPGALTYGERLHYKWLSGRKAQADQVQTRSTRATSLSRATSVPPASSAFGETPASMPESLQNPEQVLLSVLHQLLHNQAQQEEPELHQCHQQQDLKAALDTMDNNLLHLTKLMNLLQPYPPASILLHQLS
eukprot:TRINITY_DN4433_c0_g1_i4.p1 TRINITY_DN4433_c0_g1~~TRINITY_DN4433_c0_g1_i4.p1  ORF type:complete len:176 (-),score=31.07 TRINITY_DN4433_c0_g1_i4:564-1091(-)